MLDYKYVAGFVDADGSVLVHVRKREDGLFSIYPKVQIGQLAFRDELLREVADQYKVSVYTKSGTDFNTVELTGRKAVNLLENIKSHLVIKDEVANYILGLPKVVGKEELKLIKKSIKILRGKSHPTRNHPSRKWAAGYIDGDGCFSGSVKRNGTLNIKLSIACHSKATAGILLIQKAFGGNIHYGSGNTCGYECHLSMHKVREFYETFGKHLRIKKTQMVMIRDYIGENKHSKSSGATYESNSEFFKALATTKYMGRH